MVASTRMSKSKRFEFLGQLGLLVIASVGCFGTYAVALTVGLRAFLPIGAALAVAIGTLGALTLGFFVVEQKLRRSQRGVQATQQLVSLEPLELRHVA